MAVKTIAPNGESIKKALPRRKEIISAALWALCGFAAEIGAGEGAVGSSALAAGLRDGSVWIYAGGAAGALVKGFGEGFSGLGGLIIAFAGRLIPRTKSVRVNSAVQGVIAAAAAFFPACAEYSTPSALLSGIIAAITAGVFAACVMLLYDRVRTVGFDLSENGCCALAALTAGIAFMTLGRLDYPPFNLGRSAAVYFIMVSSRRHGAAGGALSAAAALFGLCCSGCAGTYESAAACMAALLSAGLCRYGKVTRALGVLFIGCALDLTAGADGDSVRLAAELAAAGTAYVLFSQKLAAAAAGVFSAEAPAGRTSAAVMRERLNFAAGALGSVNTCLEATADTLERRYCESLPDVADKAADKACKYCPNNMVCWGRKYELFHGEFDRLVRVLRCGGEITEHSLSPNAAAECINRKGVAAAVKKAYEQYLTASGERRRIRELRRVYSGQLAALGGVLSDMAEAAGRIRLAGRAAEKRAEKALAECGLKAPQAFVTKTKSGRIRLEAYGAGEITTEREYLGELLIRALGRELELPEIASSGGRVRITAVQRTALSAEIGSFQLCRGNNRICGDCYDSFYDPTGALYVVLSDGMGSGSRARIDSALACSMISRLIKGGISLAAALEAVNTALMVKSSDESFATLDICRIDMNSGECVIYKAGAAASYIKSGGRVLKASLASPPAGTGGRLTVPAQKFRVAAGDKIIMLTDGAVLGEELLSSELMREDGRLPAALAEFLAGKARSNGTGKADDITVIVIAVGR